MIVPFCCDSGSEDPEVSPRYSIGRTLSHILLILTFKLC